MRLGILDCDRLDPDLVGILVPFTRDVYMGFGPTRKLEYRVWSAPGRRSAERFPERMRCLAITGSRHDAYSDIP